MAQSWEDPGTGTSDAGRGGVMLGRNRRTLKVKSPWAQVASVPELSRRRTWRSVARPVCDVSDLSEGLQAERVREKESHFCSCLSFSSRTIPRAETGGEIRSWRFIEAF